MWFYKGNRGTNNYAFAEVRKSISLLNQVNQTSGYITRLVQREIVFWMPVCEVPHPLWEELLFSFTIPHDKCS